MATLLAVAFSSHFASAGSVQPLPPVLSADGRLGLDNVLPGSAPGTGIAWSQLAYNAGARINRWEFRWDRIETEPNVWDFSADDPAVQSSHQGGLDVLGILIGTPAWALAPGQKPGNGVPKNLGLAYTDPHNLWAEYVRQTVTRYAGEVKYWEIWNEPDLAYFWHGNADDYFGMLKDAYLTIKSIEPTAKVLIAGMVVPDLRFFDRVLQDAARSPNALANHGYFDAAAWHVYGPANSAYDNILNMRRQLTLNGFGGTPIWVTEAGFPASNPAGEPRQAAYVLQTTAFSLAAGAARILIYRASDDTTNKNWGLLDATGHPRMGYVAFQVAASAFANARGFVLAPQAGVQRVSIYRPGQRLIMLWDTATSSRSFTMPADRSSAVLTDWQGRTSALQAVDGMFAFSLPAASYNSGIDPNGSVVGSPPVLLAQSNVVPTGLNLSTTLLAPSGTGRQLILFNPGDATAQAVIAPSGSFWQHETVTLGAHTTQIVDLDLLSSPGYAGLYTFTSSSPLQLLELSSTGPSRVLRASSTWFAAAAPKGVTLGNPSGSSASVTVTSLGPRGSVRSRVTVSVPPHNQTLWSQLSSLARATLALQIKSGVPVLARPTSGGALVAQPSADWSVLHPGSSRLAVFNADSHRSVRVAVVRFGSKQLAPAVYIVKPRTTVLVRGRNARALNLSADGAIVTQYAGNLAATPAPPVVPQLETSAVLAATTAITLFNPGAQAAHVKVTTYFGGQSAVRSYTLVPLQQVSVHVRASSLRPRGLLIESDIPVATTTSH